ncbi:hypothetical protein ACLOJK_001496 [Asimina triloba]
MTDRRISADHQERPCPTPRTAAISLTRQAKSRAGRTSHRFPSSSPAGGSAHVSTKAISLELNRGREVTSSAHVITGPICCSRIEGFASPLAQSFERMMLAYRRLAARQHKFQPSQALAPLNSIYTLSDNGIEHPRLGSTLATKGAGHLIRKGTGGRSSVRHEIILHFSVHPACFS